LVWRLPDTLAPFLLAPYLFEARGKSRNDPLIADHIMCPTLLIALAGRSEDQEADLGQWRSDMKVVKVSF